MYSKDILSSLYLYQYIFFQLLFLFHLAFLLTLPLPFLASALFLSLFVLSFFLYLTSLSPSLYLPSVLSLSDCLSNHCLIVLDTLGEKDLFKPFKFEAVWTHDIRSHWVIKHAWGSVFQPQHGRRIL